jgi:hypothetical protein
LLPLLVAASRLAEQNVGRFDDLQLVRGLGMVPAGGQGVISSLLIRVGALLPLGGQPLRAGFVGALALGAIGYLTYRIAEQLLLKARRAPRLNPLLAASAALGATLSPAVQPYTGVLSAVTVASGLGLWALLVSRGAHGGRRWLGLGLLLAACVLEQRAVGLAVVIAVALTTVASGVLPTRRALTLALVGAAAVTAIFLLVALVRSYAEGPWLTLGLGTQPLATIASSTLAKPSAFSAWLQQTGMLAALLGGLGAVHGLLDRRLRESAVALLSFVLLDAVLLWGFDTVDAGSYRLLAVCSLGILAALGVQVGLMLLAQMRLPFSEPVSVLLVVFHMTLACSAIEDSQHEAPSTAANEAFTDEVLGRLPPRSLLIVKDPGMAWHAWAARVVRGERPDVVVVPLALLDHQALTGRLLQMEPTLAPLLRDMSVSGVASPDALAQLADARPLFIDFDPRWAPRRLEHLLPTALWLRYSPHPLGRSDRARALEAAREATGRVMSELTPVGTGPSDKVRAALATRVREQAALLAALGDRESVALSLGDLDRIAPDDPFSRELKQRLSKHQRGRVDVTGLLALAN